MRFIGSEMGYESETHVSADDEKTTQIRRRGRVASRVCEHAYDGTYVTTMQNAKWLESMVGAPIFYICTSVAGRLKHQHDWNTI